MRLVALTLAASIVALAACSKEAPSKPTTQPTAAPSPDTRLIIVEPKQLPLTEKEVIAGTWNVSDGALASLQHTRRFERDDKDPGLATGTMRIDIAARLYESIGDATDDFGQICTGPGGSAFVQSAIIPRGFTPAQMRISNPEMAGIGADDQWLWRAEYGRPGGEQYVTYFLCLRVRNTRAVVSTIAPVRNGAEPPNLFAETTELGKRQTQHLLEILSKMPPAPAGPRANATATRTP